MSRVSVTIDGQTFDVEVNLHQIDNDELTVVCDGEVLTVAVPQTLEPEQMEWILVDNRPYEIIFGPDLRSVRAWDGMHRIEVHPFGTAMSRPASGDGRVKAPIPGLVTKVCIERGDQVEAGEPLLVLEAMKMENEITAPRNGTVSELNVSVGQVVALHEVLVEIV